MSSNKGKDGEMRALRMLSYIVEGEENCDITRHTNTNTADGGADLVLEHPDGLLLHIQAIASGDINRESPDLTGARRVKTRIDVKTTESDLSPDSVKKFSGDIRRNPDCSGHVLMGGKKLSKQAKSDFKETQEAHTEVGKHVFYFDNQGISNLEHRYIGITDDTGENES